MAAAYEQAGDKADNFRIYRARTIAGEVLISMPAEAAGKVFARIEGKDGSVSYLPVAPVTGEKVQE